MSIGYQVRGRGSGKAAESRKMLLEALTKGKHVHVASREELWGVQLTSIGLLWIRLPGSSGRR